jgi:16S rRNA (cytosine967-C5)-methyltransferase
MKISPARAAAFEILTKIETEKAFSSILLPVYEQNLSEKDRALCHEITLGILRRQIYLDRLIETFTKKGKLDTAVKIALRIGLYQILFLDKVPDYSAINESVNLVQKAKKTSAKGLVNAVLRRATREKIEFSYSDRIEKISVETSHPRWLIEKWIEQFGFGETENLARANNEISRVAFRPTAKTSAETFDFINKFAKSEFVENCRTTEKFDPKLFRLAESGEIYVQDEASQMVANCIELEENQKFLDVCAAPGSKTTLVSSKFNVQSSKFNVQN